MKEFSFVVTVSVPNQVSEGEARDYVEDWVACGRGSKVLFQVHVMPGNHLHPMN